MQCNSSEIELSVVMPCLNEADTISICVEKAVRALQEASIRGEVILADNGSNDGSQALAVAAGARVVSVPRKGYGSALIGGISASKGKYILMGDADNSYDFLELPKFVKKLREGFDLVQGCRLPAGGGTVLPGAMPWSHRWIGNPMFSILVRNWFQAPIHDVYCGMRGFSRELFDRLDLRCTGMEFATEMIIKTSLYKEKIAEVPITLHKDGRIAHPPHLKTFRDGWRTLRFYLMYSPRWLFFLPGLLLTILGFASYWLALFRIQMGPMHFEAHTLLYGSVALLCGFQSILFAVYTKTFAITESLMPPDPRFEKLCRYFTLETGLVGGLLAFTCGITILLFVFNDWRLKGYGRLEYAETLRWAIPGATLGALGFQTILASFFISILGMKRQ